MENEPISMQEIPVDLLVGHPQNSNFLGAEMLKNLRRHIERTGIYEPLAVRSHPREEGLFEVVSGHYRV